MRKFSKIGSVPTESVEKHTKQHWDQWVEQLDKVGARRWTHKDIVAYLKKKHKLTPWWQQHVTSGYEVAIGRRVPGESVMTAHLVKSEP